MTIQRVAHISSILMVSENAERLASFYRDVLGLPLSEDHEGRRRRWACGLGDIQLSIHPPEDFDDPRVGVGSLRLAFAVKDIDEMVEGLETRGVNLLFPPRDVGWGKVTAVHDPDGNYVELIQLGDDWFRHLDRDPPLSLRRRFKLESIDG